jgi:peptide/nickel transport system permease protein
MQWRRRFPGANRTAAASERTSPRKLRWILGFLGALHTAVLFAAFIAPYHFARQHRDFPFAPPTRLHWIDPTGRLHLRPFVYGLKTDPATNLYREDPTQFYPLEFFRRGRLFGVPQPGVIFLFGSDAYGRDVLSRVLYGGQVSLFTGLAAAFLSLSLGLVFGLAAGFYSGWPDQILMRSGELFLALPWLYLLLAARAFLPLHIDTVQAFLLLSVIIGTVGWVRPARLIRGVVLSGREHGFVLAARGFGASDIYLIRRHILPLTFSVVVTQATLLIPQYILAEVTLSFLGLGVGEPVPSWGNMLADARQYHTLVSHAWMVAPGLAMVPILMSYLFAADALLDALPDKTAN